MIFILTLKRSIIRNKILYDFYSQFNSNEYIIVNGIDGDNLHVNGTMPKRVLGAGLSHKYIYKYILDNNLDYGIIVENDVLLDINLFNNDKEKILNKLTNNTIIYLESSNPFTKFPKEQFGKIKNSSMGCYIINNYTANVLFTTLEKKQNLDIGFILKYCSILDINQIYYYNNFTKENNKFIDSISQTKLNNNSNNLGWVINYPFIRYIDLIITSKELFILFIFILCLYITNYFICYFILGIIIWLILYFFLILKYIF